MSYVSISKKISVIKKEISKGIFRDRIKLECPSCKKVYISDFSFKITCPFCSNTIDTSAHKEKDL